MFMAEEHSVCGEALYVRWGVYVHESVASNGAAELLFFFVFVGHRFIVGSEGRVASLWWPRQELLLERKPNVVCDVRVPQNVVREPFTRLLLKLLAIAIKTVRDIQLTKF